jgi:hypothetical protein
MKVPNKVLNIVSRFAAEGTHPTITPEERELVFKWAKAGIEKRSAAVSTKQSNTEEE